MKAFLEKLKQNKLVAACAVALLAAVLAALSPELRGVVSSALNVAPAGSAAAVDSQ